MYAHIIGDNPDPSKLEKYLDEPLPSELTSEERKLAEMRRIADANRGAVAALDKTARMRHP